MSRFCSRAWCLLAAVSAGLLYAPASTARAADNKIPDDVMAILEKAETFELLSLDPARTKEKPKDHFHNWKLLGKTVADKDARRALLAALEKGIKENRGEVAACFNPRHGIRATHDKKTVELVICFECYSLQIYVDGKFSKNVLTTGSPQSAFDKVLRSARVPLPPKAEK